MILASPRVDIGAESPDRRSPAVRSIRDLGERGTEMSAVGRHLVREPAHQPSIEIARRSNRVRGRQPRGEQLPGDRLELIEDVVDDGRGRQRC